MRRVPRVLFVAAVLALLAASCGDDSGSDSSDEAKPHTEASEAELEIWQTDLNAVGCYAGQVDGSLGPQTEEAIKEFQAAEGLTVDGLLGPETEDALQEAVAEGRIVCAATSSPPTSDPPDDGGGAVDGSTPSGPDRTLDGGAE
jgi:peptidoglycan hydrolase-like protein with peptidoglycan-binding domain